MAKTFIKKFNLHTLIFVILLLTATFLATFKLESYPPTWFDEGWYLQIPKNLVMFGEYAPRSVEGFRYTDTTVGGIPTFYLPISAMFKLFGIGLLQARLVIVGYFLISCTLLYLVAKKLYGVSAALIALALFIFIKPDDNFTSALIMGRQVMGEIPAFCFFLLALFSWLLAFEKDKKILLGIAGICFGVAMSTKGQFMLLVPPTLITLALIDRFYYQQKRYSYFAAPLLILMIVVLLKYLFLFFILGQEKFLIYWQELSTASGPQVRVLFSPAAMATALKLFLRSWYFIWVLPALVYTFILCLPKTPNSIKQCFLWVFVTGLFTWFLIASVGWARYVFPALGISYILVAKLLNDLGNFAEMSTSKWSNSFRNKDFVPIARQAAVFVLLVMMILISSAPMLSDIVVAPTPQSAHQFAQYIDTQVEDNELIETWEWEVAFLTKNQSYHHPPTALLPVVIADINLGLNYDPNVYNFLSYKPAYIVVGPFAKWTGIYPPEFLENKTRLVKTIGEYNLYKITK